MVKEGVSVFLLYCALVNCVSAKLEPSTIEPFPDLYAMASTYPAASVVNYNASPNPQYSTNNYNHFNEPSPPTPSPSPQIPGNYQNMEYQEKPTKPQKTQKTQEDPIVGNDSTKPTTETYDYNSDLKNTLSTMKDNLGFITDTQRMLLNSFKVQQQQYNDIEEKLEAKDSDSQRSANYNYAPPPASPQPQYQSIPSLPPLPYSQQTNAQQAVHHHKHHILKKGLGKLLLKKRRNGRGRELAVIRRRSEAARLEKHAAMTLTYIRNGIMNALWTAVIVACVKLIPLLLFGFKLMFRSVLPLTGIALFGAGRGLFPQHHVK
ncbi:hypothetical protein Bhyg_16694, partial [Pseudolycoriella hygida]